MYLTRLTLDLRAQAVRRDLADAYDMHRSLVRAFATDDKQTPPRFLWRLEPESLRGAPVVLIQSAQPPNASAFVQPGYLSRPAETKPLDLSALVETERRYRFRLLANPTVTRDGKRYGLASESEQIDWLTRKADKSGFVVETALVTASDVVFLKNGDIVLQQACFEGVLTAKDDDALQTATAQGIGPGKAFGLGLLSLSPR